MPNVVTVREAVERAKQDGFPVSECALRRWIKTGAVPVRKAGKKQLLYYPNLLQFLKCEDGGDLIPVPMVSLSGIRRVEV